MSGVSRQAERLARQKLREQRRKNPSTVRGQLNIEQAKMHAFNQRIASGQFGLLGPKEEEEKLPSVEDLPAAPEKEVAQISFIVQKKCLACKRVNHYSAISCAKCGGHFCYDKTPYIGDGGRHG